MSPDFTYLDSLMCLLKFSNLNLMLKNSFLKWLMNNEILISKLFSTNKSFAEPCLPSYCTSSSWFFNETNLHDIKKRLYSICNSLKHIAVFLREFLPNVYEITRFQFSDQFELQHINWFSVYGVCWSEKCVW